jgi:hypothetical protein
MAAAKNPFEALLARGQKNVAKFAAEAKKKGAGIPVDDGDYTAQYTSFQSGIKEATGEKEASNWIRRGWTLLEDSSHDGKNIGLNFSQFRKVNDDEDIKYLLGDHIQLGVDPEEADYDLNQLTLIEQTLIEAETIAKVRIKTNINGYQNLYIQKRIDDYEGEKAAELSAITEDEEDETPAPKSAAPPPAKKGSKAVVADDDDEDDEDDTPSPEPASTKKQEEEPEVEAETGIGDIVHWTDDEDNPLEGKIIEILNDKKGEAYAIRVETPKKGLKKAKVYDVALDDNSLDAGAWPEDTEE